jgi:hypothetical protein
VQAKILRQMGLLEAFATHAADRYKWPHPFSIVARSCGDPNAAWDIGKKTLTLCYELAGEFIELWLAIRRSSNAGSISRVESAVSARQRAPLPLPPPCDSVWGLSLSSHGHRSCDPPHSDICVPLTTATLLPLQWHAGAQ